MEKHVLEYLKNDVESLWQVAFVINKDLNIFNRTAYIHTLDGLNGEVPDKDLYFTVFMTALLSEEAGIAFPNDYKHIYEEVNAKMKDPEIRTFLTSEADGQLQIAFFTDKPLGLTESDGVVEVCLKKGVKINSIETATGITDTFKNRMNDYAKEIMEKFTGGKN